MMSLSLEENGCFGFGIGLATPRLTVKRLLPDPCPKNNINIYDAIDFSPDGQHLVYGFSNLSGSGIAILNLRTGKHRIVVASRKAFVGPGHPSYLADGRILFTRIFGRRPGTYIVHRDGSGAHRLFRREYLATSPNGRWFLANLHRRLCLLDRNGHRVRRLVNRPASDPSFSPDGRTIAFTRSWGSGPNTDLFLIHRNGGNLRRLTRNRDSSTPTFSPNGRWIAFSRIRSGTMRKDENRANIVALSVEHPGRRRTITRVRDPLLWSPTWGVRKIADSR